MDVQLNRKHDILAQCIRKYKNPSFDITKPLNVQFVGVDEQGIDAGGITRVLLLSYGEYEQTSSDGITLLESA